MCTEKLWLEQSGDEDLDDEEESQAEEDDDHGGCILAHSMGIFRASCAPAAHVYHHRLMAHTELTFLPQ